MCLMKAHLRISVKHYRRGATPSLLQRVPFGPRQFWVRMNGQPWPQAGRPVSIQPSVARATGLCRPATRRTERQRCSESGKARRFSSSLRSFRSAGRRPERAGRPHYPFSVHALPACGRIRPSSPTAARRPAAVHSLPWIISSAMSEYAVTNDGSFSHQRPFSLAQEPSARCRLISFSASPSRQLALRPSLVSTASAP